MTITSRSPQQPKDVVVEVPAAGTAQVHAQVQRSGRAQHAWTQQNASARAQALHQAADAVEGASDELVTLMVREVGKPSAEARAEVARSTAILRYYAQQTFEPNGAMHEPSASGLLFTQRQPRGVAGLITPWNFPLAIPLWKAAPALAFGNSVVLKPAPEATACALRLQELLAGVLPQDLLLVVPGDVETGEALVDSADVISFTGSLEAGQSVALAATKRGISVQAEMGGQNPALVLPDVDVESVAGQVSAAAMGYAGQKCTATKRVIVVGDPAPFRDALVAAVERLTTADPAAAATVVGPVISEDARAKVIHAAATAQQAGARILTGGNEINRDGWFVAPTVVEGVPKDHALSCEEVFGPICALQAVDSVEDAVAAANAVRHGLTAGVYTPELSSALRVCQRLQAGNVKVNAPTTGVDFYLPFGGEKASSIGPREQGKAAQEFYTSVRTITLSPGLC